MGKIDKTVLKETKYIALWVIVFSLFMQAVFLILGEWDYTVLLGNTLSSAAAVLNFFLLGITIQKALEKDEVGAKNTMKVSKLYRLLLLVIVLILGVTLPCFHTWAVIVPVFFPRIALAFRPFFDKKQS